MLKNLCCGVFVLLLLSACSSADVTGDESLRQYGDTVFTNHGGTQTIVVKLYGASAKRTDQSNESDPTASADPNISVGLNGGTSSLAADGGKMLLEGITSMIDAGVNNSSPVVTPEPEPVPPPVIEKPTTVDPPVGNIIEKLDFHGRTNGERATWYGNKTFSSYSSPMRVVITGCADKVINHDGVRYDDGKLIVKQSDVAGRGMAVLYHTSCKSETATVVY